MIPVFYRHLSAALHAGGDDSPLVFATAVYLDSLPARLDTGYLLVQVALEGFCKAFSESSGKSPSLVRKKEWRAFIDEHETELRGFGIDTDSADQFLEKLRNEAPRLRTSRLVENTFRSMGIELPEEVCLEIRERDKVAHLFVMSPETKRDWRKDVIRLDMIPTLLIAAMSNVIGYEGPIAGWEKDRFNGATSPAWWSAKDDALAHTMFLAYEGWGEPAS